MNVCYDKLWKLLIDKKMKKTDLIREAKISSNVLAKMGKEVRSLGDAAVHDLNGLIYDLIVGSAIFHPRYSAYIYTPTENVGMLSYTSLSGLQFFKSKPSSSLSSASEKISPLSFPSLSPSSTVFGSFS